MKFTTLTLSALSLASLISGAPVPAETTEEGDYLVKDILIPEESILATQVIGADLYPYVVEYGGQKIVLLVNTTAADEIVGSSIDFDSLESNLANSTDVEKRDAEADARWKWKWIKYRFGQPIAKREDVDIDAREENDPETPSDMIKREAGVEEYNPAELLTKREANADAKWKWKWIRYRFGQPIAKREAEAEARWKWKWIKYRFGQPIAKREDGAGDVDDDDSAPGFFWISQKIDL